MMRQIKVFCKEHLPEKYLFFLNSCLFDLRSIYSSFPFRQYTKKYKCIFIHIPKTAGTSILFSLMGDKINRDHASFYDFKRANPFKFEVYYKFCFVRNPYDRLISLYEYLKRGGNKGGDLYFQALLKEGFPSFEEFVLNYLNSYTMNEHVLFRPQYLFIFDYMGECQVDYIGRYENLADDFNIICNKLGVQLELKQTNKSKRESYESYYKNPRVKEKVECLYRKDFEMLGYSFL